MYSILRNTFQELRASSYSSIQGVMTIDSGIEGPVLGLTIMTHSNEPAGLMAARHIINKMKNGWTPLKGKVILCINNLKGAEHFFSHDAWPDRNTAKRYLEFNMNRLPETSEALKGNKAYETQRAYNLLPIWQEFTHALDFHSSKQDMATTLFTGHIPVKNSISRFLGVPRSIENITPIQTGVPAFIHYGKGSIDAFELEGGPHNNQEYLKSIPNYIDLLLECLGIQEEATPLPIKQEIDIYEVFGRVLFPNKSYRVAALFPSYDFVKKGTILAKGDGDDLPMPEDGHILFAPQHYNAVDISEEVMFLTKPMKKYYAKS